jgi:hypothetical protein
MDADVIPDLAKLIMSENPGVSKAAREAIVTLTHGAGKDTSTPKRGEVVKRLLDQVPAANPLPVRAHALRQLSLIAGEDSVPVIAKWIHQADMREEVAFCLERIPGAASNKAFLAAYSQAKDDFKPRILAALGHRRAAEAVPLCVEAMRSPNKDIALAATKAFGRIGGKPAGAFRPPDAGSLSAFQRTEHMDALLRYADAQAKQGNAAEALRLYKTALEKPEEHWQCAAIVGIAKIQTPEAASVIFPKLKSGQRNVRATAQKAWDSLKGG